MMWTALRSFLLWILVVALPVQGIADAAVRPCGMTSSSETSEARDAGPAASLNGDELFTTAVDEDTCADDCQHFSHSCQSCQHCCVGLHVLPLPMLGSAMRLSTEGAASFLTNAFSNHIPQRIERPPRVDIARHYITFT